MLEPGLGLGLGLVNLETPALIAACEALTAASLAAFSFKACLDFTEKDLWACKKSRS